jgi:hypothetical protein
MTEESTTPAAVLIFKKKAETFRWRVTHNLLRCFLTQVFEKSLLLFTGQELVVA